MRTLSEWSTNGESVIAFMPIKPEYAQRILTGEKQFEFRRTSIRPDLTHLVIYSSSPIKRIVALAEVDFVEMGSPSTLWERTKHAAGISREKFRKYFSGKESAVAISLKRVFPLLSELEPSEIEEGFSIPQSFRYVDAEFLGKVVSLGFVSDAESA